MKCPDGGTCHHGCPEPAAAPGGRLWGTGLLDRQERVCWRVKYCSPLSGSGLGPDWKPDNPDPKAKHPERLNSASKPVGPRPDIEPPSGNTWADELRTWSAAKLWGEHATRLAELRAIPIDYGVTITLHNPTDRFIAPSGFVVGTAPAGELRWWLRLLDAELERRKLAGAAKLKDRTRANSARKPATVPLYMDCGCMYAQQRACRRTNYTMACRCCSDCNAGCK